MITQLTQRFVLTAAMVLTAGGVSAAHVSTAEALSAPGRIDHTMPHCNDPKWEGNTAVVYCPDDVSYRPVFSCINGDVWGDWVHAKAGQTYRHENACWFSKNLRLHYLWM